MELENEKAKDYSNQEKEPLGTYDLFRLNLILKPDGLKEGDAYHAEEE